MTSVQIASRRERRRIQTRQRIVAAATSLFAERGFEAPTIEEIAAAADVGKGTIYNYFPSKEAILFEFLVGVEEQTQARLGDFTEMPGAAEEILAAWLRLQFQLKRPYLGFVRVFLSQLIQRAGAFEEQILALQQHVDPPLLGLLRRLQERGLIAADLALDDVARELKHLHFGLSCLWALEGPPFRQSARALEVQVAGFCRLLERGEL